MAPVEGSVAAGFESVQDAFAANFDRDEHGAAVAAYVGDRCVVDLWGGFVDRDGTQPWRRDTIVNCFSVGKGVLSILALEAVGCGEIGLDEPLSRLWPATANLSPRLTLRECMTHRAGVPAVRRQLGADAIYDWAAICAALVDQEPYWEPGTAHGYHVNTFGYLVGEILCRATGRTLGALLRERLGDRLDADFHFGLATPQHGRVSPVFMVEEQLTEPDQWAVAFPPTGDAEHDAMIRSAYFNPPGFSGIGTVNTAPWRSATIPSTNSHGNARGIARLFRALLSQRSEAISDRLVAEAASAQVEGHDVVLGKATRYGLGFQLPFGTRGFGPSPTAFGHYGYGGSLGLADPEQGVSFGYCTNKPGARFDTGRTADILDATYASL